MRMGAPPAPPGQLGFVGGSMGDAAVIVRGKSDCRSGPQITRPQIVVTAGGTEVDPYKD